MKSVFRDGILDGKVAFVTGGGSGICKGITESFMAHGAHAVILGRKVERLEEAARELSQKTAKQCIPIGCDVRDGKQVEAALDQAIAKLGKIDVVVNGAAGNFLAPAAALSYNGFKTVLEIDAMGTFNVCRASFDKWLRDHGGHIVNISATLHYAATPLQIHAASAKAAVDTITRTLALEWGSLGIQVNGIAPGPIADTEGYARLAPPGFAEKVASIVPLGRLGTIEDIAQCATWLVSGAASYVHGETIVVDGGAWLPGAKAMMP